MPWEEQEWGQEAQSGAAAGVPGRDGEGPQPRQWGCRKANIWKGREKGKDLLEIMWQNRKSLGLGGQQS